MHLSYKWIYCMSINVTISVISFVSSNISNDNFSNNELYSALFINKLFNGSFGKTRSLLLQT